MIKENDIDLFYAEDDKQARDILLNLINEEIASNDNINPDEVFIAKSKSNTLREINASEFLEENGMVIVDTDLGDRILQLKKGDNSPLRFILQAPHLI